MADLDPNIILDATKTQAPTANDNTQGLVSMFSLASAIKKQRQDTLKQNTLLKVFSDPNSVDPTTGLPTPKATQAIMAVDPETGLKLRDANLDAQVKRAQLQHYQTDAGKANFDFMAQTAGIGADAYDDAIKAGKTPQQAAMVGQAARNEAVKNNGGAISDDVADGILSKPFDPAGAKALAMTDKEYATRAQQKIMDKNAADRLAYQEKHGDQQFGAEMAKLSQTGNSKWQVLTDPPHKGADGQDVPATQYRYNPENAQATTLDGKPYSPAGAAKLGGGGSGGGADFTPKMGELMAATAEQGVSLPTGFRSKAQQVELYQGLLDRNPDKSPDEIAKMLKTGQIEFGAQKKETQTAAGIAGKVEVAANELKQFVPLVRSASADLKRSNIKSLNELVQTADSQLSDPKLKTLKGYIVGTLNAYDVLASRGGTDAEKRAENRQQLLSADGDKAINAALDVIMKESDIAHQSSVAATRVPELEDSSPKPHPQDSAAISWAKANPKDPRAAKILQANGVQ